MTDVPLTAERCPVCFADAPDFQFEARSPWRQASSPYRVFGCRICAHRWCVGDVSPALLASIYGAGFHDSAQQAGGAGAAVSETAPVLANAVRRARWLRRIGLGGRLLDVGAGVGYFVLAAAREGFDATGIDLSQAAVEKGAALGVRIAQGDILDEKADRATVDVVTLWDAMCGMIDPHRCMAEVAVRLGQGGSCVMTVADGRSLTARLAGRYWPLMIPPVNLHFFSRESMTRLLDAHGMAITLWRADGKRVSIRFALQKLARTLRIGGAEPAIERLVPARWAVALNFGDIATVVAERRRQPA